MKRGAIILLALMLSAAMPAHAQGGKQSVIDSMKKAMAAIKPIPVYLGKSDVRGGEMNEKRFDELMKQGLTARDTGGVAYKIKGFMFGYKEPNLYEDEAGNLMVYTEYYGEYCLGDTLTPLLKATLYDRTKAGDTLYFDRITLIGPDSAEAQGAPISVYLK